MHAALAPGSHPRAVGLAGDHLDARADAGELAPGRTAAIAAAQETSAAAIRAGLAACTAGSLSFA